MANSLAWLKSKIPLGLSLGGTGQTTLAGIKAAFGITALEQKPTPPLIPAVGTFVNLNPGNGIAFTLPAGGTWAYWAQPYLASSGAAFDASYAGVNVGGTVVISAVAGRFYSGFAWRIA